MSFVITLFLSGLVATNGILRGTSTGTIESLDLSKALGGMQPEVVAKLLTQVESRWMESRVASLRNQTDESEAFAEMTKSCQKVAKAVIDGSEGDKDRVVEYMADVCSNSNGAHKKGCDSFAAGIESTMTNSNEVNRDTLDLSKFCSAYWQTVVSTDAKAEAERLNTEEATRAKEEAERAEAEKKAQETQAAEKKEADAMKQESDDMEEAEKLQKVASDDEAKASDNTKAVEERIAQAEDKATKLVDKAQEALQLAAEKEAQAAEPKAEEPTPEEPKAEEPKVEAEVNATSVEAPAADEKAAEAAGDAVADKIAEKALAKVEKPAEAAAVKTPEAPKKVEAPKNVEVAKKF